MNRFRYAALDHKGSAHRGILEAASPEAAVAALARTYAAVTEVKELRPSWLMVWFNRIRPQRVTTEHLLSFSHELSAMLNAGLSLKAALDIIAADAGSERMAYTVDSICQQVQQGIPLANAMARHGSIFPPNYVSLVRAGENSGTLPLMLERLADQLSAAEALTSKVKGAFYYPAVVLAFAGILSAIIIAVGIPMLKGMYGSMAMQLPLPTRILLAMSNALSHWWGLMLLALVAMVVSFRKLIATPWGALAFDRIRLRIPFVGSVLRDLAVARFARNFSTVFGAGIPILQALEFTLGTTGSATVDESVRNLIPRIEEGASLSTQLRESGHFSSIVVGLVAAGENSGCLDTMVGKLAEFYEDRVDSNLKSLTSIIEPVLMAGVGLMLGGLILALGLPFLNLSMAVAA